LFIGIVLLTGFVHTAKAQGGFINQAQSRFGGLGGGSSGGSDSIGHRTGLEDSITIHFRYLDTSRLASFDSVLYDFNQRISVPWYHITLGNYGTASRSLLFTPNMKPGF